MPKLPHDVLVSVFDPATPFQKVLVGDAGVDTWHGDILITKELRSQLPHVDDLPGLRRLPISGGMSVEVPAINIGIQLGPFRIDEIDALVVNQGNHDLLLGSSVFSKIFKAGYRANARQGDCGFDGERNSGGSKGGNSAYKDDPEALAIELYPVEYPFPSQHLEKILRSQRVLHNVALIATGKIGVVDLGEDAVDAIIEKDAGIPDHLTLKISSVADGSIWMTLKSGSASSLKYVASFFQKGASAKLAQEVAEAEGAEVRSQISKASRDATAMEIISEKEKLQAENIHSTYEVFRAEARARIDFLDEMIEKVEDPRTADQLRRRKDAAILEITEQQMVPVVRNVPGTYFGITNGLLALPPSGEIDT